jgi:hypothetical protein
VETVTAPAVLGWAVVQLMTSTAHIWGGDDFQDINRTIYVFPRASKWIMATSTRAFHHFSSIILMSF